MITIVKPVKQPESIMGTHTVVFSRKGLGSVRVTLGVGCESKQYIFLSRSELTNETIDNGSVMVVDYDTWIKLTVNEFTFGCFDTRNFLCLPTSPPANFASILYSIFLDNDINLDILKYESIISSGEVIRYHQENVLGVYKKC